MELNWQNQKKIMAIVAFGIVLYIGLQNLDVIGNWLQVFFAILTPFLLGACIAFVVNLPMKFFEKMLEIPKKSKKKIEKEKKQEVNKGKRFMSIFLSFLLILLLIGILIQLVIPELLNVAKTFIQYLSGLPGELKPILDDLVTNHPELGEEVSKLQLDFSNILNSSITFLKEAGTGLASWIGKAISSTVSGIANFVIGIIFAFYLLMSKEKIGKNLKRIVLAFMPEKYAYKTLEITALSKDAFTNFITGQLKEAMVLGVLCYFGMLILQLPYSLTISLFTMVTALIPVFGAFIGAAVGVVLLLAVSPWKALIFLVFIIVLQQIETNLIYPRVVGDSVGLPGVIVLVAITIGGNLWGVVGMLVSLPIVSVIYTLLRASVEKRLRKKHIEIEVGEKKIEI